MYSDSETVQRMDSKWSKERADTYDRYFVRRYFIREIFVHDVQIKLNLHLYSTKVLPFTGFAAIKWTKLNRKCADEISNDNGNDLNFR